MPEPYQSPSFYQEGDLVYVPQKGKRPALKGKVIKKDWKNNGEWVTVEVIYEDMTGTSHTTTLPPLRPSTLRRRDA